MKRKHILPILSLMMIISLNSCQKSDSLIADHSDSLNEKTSILSKIKNFHKAITNDYKSGRTLCVDSVKWYTEADINYFYCESTKKFLYSKIDSFELSAPVDSNNLMNDYEYNQLYKAMIDSLGTFWYSFNENTKFLVVVDVSYVGTSNYQAHFKMYSYMGYGLGNFTPPEFGDTDYWLWWGGLSNNGGKCGSFSGYQNFDAAILIEQKIRWMQQLTPGTVFYNISFFEVFGGDTDCTGSGNPQDNYMDYRIFWQYHPYQQYDPLYGTDHECLDPSEMNFHYSGTKQEYYNTNPTGLDRINLDIDDSFMSFSTGSYSYGHKGQFFYGNSFIDINRTIINL